MKRSNFLRSEELFPGSDTVRKYTFKMTETGDNCALLAIANHRLAHDFAIEGISAPFFKDMIVFECLSPHKIAV
ncbi:MAG: hypothetical protein ACYCWE_01210 [Eubacteriales bacterium]